MFELYDMVYVNNNCVEPNLRGKAWSCIWHK